MSRLLRAHAAWLVVAALATAAQAMPGDLDPSFGHGGKLRLRVSQQGASAQALLVQPDGKIVAAGYALEKEGDRPLLEAVVVRLLADGAIDPSFGTGGKVALRSRRRSAVADAVALQPDGRIVVAGTVHNGRSRTRFWVARLEADGSLDASFGENGIVTTAFEGVNAYAVALLLTREGKILVGGGAYPTERPTGGTFALARYLENGRLDPGFARRGRLRLAGVASVAALAEQADGAVVVALATRFAAVRFLTNGTLDPTFGVSGIAAADFADFADFGGALAVGEDGTIILGGPLSLPPFDSDADFGLVRYRRDGTLDPTFGDGGKTLSRISRFADLPAAMIVRPDGRILLAGCTEAGFPFRGTRFALAQYRSDGTLDPSFGREGVVLTTFGTNRQACLSGVALQGNDRIVAAGFVFRIETGPSDFALARFEW